MTFDSLTEDGRYGLKANGELWRITKDPANTYMAGYVMNPANIEYAAEVADEEARVLMAQARAEFGFDRGSA